QLLSPCRWGLAEVVEPPLTTGMDIAGEDDSTAGAVSAATAAASNLPGHVANPWTEEPDAGNPHVRIRGSLGPQSPSRPDPPLSVFDSPVFCGSIIINPIRVRADGNPGRDGAVRRMIAGTQSLDARDASLARASVVVRGPARLDIFPAALGRRRGINSSHQEFS